MAEPQDMVPEVLKEMRADMRRAETSAQAFQKETAKRFEYLETKLDGLRHAVVAGFGSIVHELEDIKTRVGRLEHERA